MMFPIQNEYWLITNFCEKHPYGNCMEKFARNTKTIGIVNTQNKKEAGK